MERISFVEIPCHKTGKLLCADILKGEPHEFYSQNERIAVWFDISLEESLRRNNTRSGKFIPVDIIKRMHETFVRPTKAEGFDQIIKPLT